MIDNLTSSEVWERWLEQTAYLIPRAIRLDTRTVTVTVRGQQR